MRGTESPEDRLVAALRVAAEYRARVASGHAEPLAELLARHEPLRAALEALLSPSTVGSTGDAAVPPGERVPPLPPRIGPFKVLRLLGKGGMGIVYLAEEEAPVQRRVALKVLNVGLDAKAVLALLEQERQALAVMNHDAIAKMYGGGTTEEGQPYFVMELVEGEPLTTYCDRLTLTLRERIALLQRVCEGVQHAHLKFVAHRDLKPGNVLVVNDAGRHVVKIIDFGIARAIDPNRTPGAVTRLGLVGGTLEYMAPEQTLGDSRLVDARADVYSLGAILYELLVGDMPFPDLQRLSREAAYEIIRNVDPPRPSARVAQRGGASNERAGLRRRTATGLSRELHGDLDKVVQKAMAKEPERRYATPADLAADLQRYLEHRPVVAETPTTGYVLRKFVLRYRGQVSAAAAVFVTAIVGAIVALQFAATASRRELEKTQLLAGSVAKEAQLAAGDGNWADASAKHEQAISLGADDPVRENIGRHIALEGLGNLQDSSAILEELARNVRSGPHAARVAMLVGAANMDRDRSAAMAALHRAEELDRAGDSKLMPADREFVAAMLATDLDVIIGHLRAALVHDGQHLPSLDLLGPVLLFAGQADAALEIARVYSMFYRDAAQPRLLRLMVLAAQGRTQEAKATLHAMDGPISEFEPLMAALIDLYGCLERRLDEQLRSTVTRTLTLLPLANRTLRPPTIAVPEPSATLETEKLFATALLRVVTAIGKIDTAEDEAGIRLRLHPWVLDHYSMPRLQLTGRCLFGSKPIPADQGLPEALLMIASGNLTGTAVDTRDLRGVTASLPSVRRAAARLQIDVALICAASAGSPANGLLAQAIGGALVLPLAEPELRTYAFVAASTLVADRLLVDRVVIRWRELHGESLQWLAFRAEQLLARGDRAGAVEAMRGAAALGTEDPWVVSLRTRIGG